MTHKAGPSPGPLFFFYNDRMIPQRHGQVWLYHGGTPLRELLQPHGFKEHVPALENPSTTK